MNNVPGEPKSDSSSSAHLTGMGNATGSKTSNATHSKRLARTFAERSGRPYSQALDIVTAAATAGRLPEPLDVDGMAQAIEILMAIEPAAAAATEPAPTPGPDEQAPCHAARTGEGYWTCDQHGCSDCRALATEIADTEQIAVWDAERRDQAGARATQTASEDPQSLYLEPSYLAMVRLVWQGRVTKEALDNRKAARWVIDNKPATSARGTTLILLERDGYIEAPLPATDEWTVARTTDFGDEVLAANRADGDKFHDGLPAGTGLNEASGPAENRRPYVGEGADGARRSAEIDRSEADGLDRNDPRHAERLASAEAWDRQAEHNDRAEIGVTPVNAALAAVEKTPFYPRSDRRKASGAADQRIWDLSWVYEQLTGQRGLIYVTSPGSGADRYVFGGRHTALGHRQALEHITGLVEALRLRDDVTWPPPERPAQGETVVDGPGAYGRTRFFVDIPREYAEPNREHSYWGHPAPEAAGKLIAIDTRGDQYDAQSAADLVLGKTGWGGIAADYETGPEPDGVIGWILDHRHRRADREGALAGISDCLGCTSPHLARWGSQVGQGPVCKACADDVHGECVGRRLGDIVSARNPAGLEPGERRCHCYCRDVAIAKAADHREGPTNPVRPGETEDDRAAREEAMQDIVTKASEQIEAEAERD